MQGLRIHRIGLALAVGTSVVVLAATARQPDSDSDRGPTPKSRTDPKINDPFKKPDVKQYIKKFESEDRENYALRHEIVAALNLVPGMAVADVGGGHRALHPAVRREGRADGKVYAVDIAPRFLEHIAADAKKRRQSQVVTILGEPGFDQLARGIGGPGLPERRVSPPGEAGEDPGVDPAGVAAGRPAGRDRIRPRGRARARRSCSSTSAPARRSSARRSRRRGSSGSRHPTPALKENFFLRFEKPVEGRFRRTESRAMLRGCGAMRREDCPLDSIHDNSTRGQRARRSRASPAACARSCGPRLQTSTNAWASASRQDSPASSSSLARRPHRSRQILAGQPATRRDRPADGTPGAVRLFPRAGMGDDR